MSDIVKNSYLASVLGRPKGGYITANNQFRRYAAHARTESVIGGLPDHRVTSIFYEIGRHREHARDVLLANGDNVVTIESAYPTSSVLSEEFIGLAKKYSNFSSSFEYSNLAGMVERLGKTLGCLSLYQNLTSDHIRGGEDLRIDALSTFGGPVTSLSNTVFIPRIVNSNLTGDVFSVLANAAAGEGASVATDILQLDAVTRAPIVGVVDVGLAKAVVEALRILGANMQCSDQGPLFALALTRGIHAAVSVVGHTDEGGVTRDILRAGKFSTAFGGIHSSLPTYAGLPALSTNNVVDVAVYVDGIALTTAALVAHCDPGVIYNGLWFPTFYNGTSSADRELRPGQAQEGNDGMAYRNSGQLIANYQKFAAIYCPALAKLFTISGSSENAERFLSTAVSVCPRNLRHLRYPTVTPFFWIEPTSLIPHDFVGSRAEQEGSGAFATPNITRERSAWEDIDSVGSPDATFSAYAALVRNPRSAWFFAHWLNNPRNGLGSISVRQLDPNMIIQPGHSDAEEQLRDRVEAGLPWTDYLWTRGQSPFCAPGEMLNLGGTVGFMVKHMTMDDDGIPFEEHVPMASEFLTTPVRIQVSIPNGIATGPSNWRDNGARRARTKAAKELAASSARARVFGRSDVAEMPFSTTSPVLRSRPVPRDERQGSDGGTTVWAHGHTQSGHDNSPTEKPRGVPRPAVAHHAPQRMPQITRPGNQGGGGVIPAQPQQPDAEADQAAQPVAHPPHDSQEPLNESNV